ncbi:MAG: flavin reductase family protein [Croceivirga sp.]
MGEIRKNEMYRLFTYDQLMEMPSRYRGVLLNKVSGVKPANLIGTQSKDGQTNLAVFNSVVHIGANPPYLGFILRPTTVERHTYDNIKATGVYTINQITTQIVQQAHQTSAKYDRTTSEFNAVGLTACYHEGFQAPFVGESHIKMGLQFEEEHYLSCNDTRLVVGKIQYLLLPEGLVEEDGNIALEQLDSVAIGGLDSYYTIEKLGRYAYAKAN